MKKINVVKLHEIIRNVKIIDVREKYEYDGYHIPGAINVPKDIFIKDHIKYIDDVTECYVVCQSGKRSTETIKKINSDKLINVIGGTIAYYVRYKNER